MIYNDLALFTVAAKQLSFSATAKQLNIPLSRVSRRIAELEQHLGVRLFERSTRQVRLTEEGVRLLDRCLAPMEALQEATGFVDNIKSQVINLTAPVVATRTTIGPMILDYAARHPDVSINLTTTNAMLDFYRDRIDVAFRLGPLSDSNLISRKLWNVQYCFCASTQFIETHLLQKPITQEELAKLPAVVSHQEWLLSNREIVKPENVVHRIDDLDLILEATHRNLGVAMLPKDMLSDGVQEIQLKDAKALEREMCAIYPSKRLLPSRVRSLIDFMVHE